MTYVRTLSLSLFVGLFAAGATYLVFVDGDPTTLGWTVILGMFVGPFVAAGLAGAVFVGVSVSHWLHVRLLAPRLVIYPLGTMVIVATLWTLAILLVSGGAVSPQFLAMGVEQTWQALLDPDTGGYNPNSSETYSRQVVFVGAWAGLAAGLTMLLARSDRTGRTALTDSVLAVRHSFERGFSIVVAPGDPAPLAAYRGQRLVKVMLTPTTRASVREFLTGIVLLLALVLLLPLLMWANFQLWGGAVLLLLPFPILSLVPSWILFCLYVNRLHDLGRSGAWVMAPFPAAFLLMATGFLNPLQAAAVAPPLLYLIAALALLALAGQSGDNRFGADPRAARP
jgi:uncharacterized membrane protein YhaH (DUF805 family)